MRIAYKKSLLICVGLLMLRISYSQFAFDRYKSYIDPNNEFEMGYFVNTKQVYINTYTKLKEDYPAGIIFNQKKLSDFYEGFKKARDKYVEWKKIAEARDVTDMTKDMPFSYKTDIFFTRNGEKTTSTTLCKFKFITSTVEGVNVYMLLFASGPIQLYEFTSKEGKVTYDWIPDKATGFSTAMGLLSVAANKTRVIDKFDGVVIMFNKESEIEEFIAKITPERIKDVEKLKGNLDEQQRIKKQKEKFFN